ncbi:hypothetical protein NDU88_001770 [Pleurodeles waltl]|uniref:Uncharacterized protein n=1 Tax=Pleurodeles waltl TaxID=8319 RepID=A0AAV7P6G4_PLEWA|nr:hypothetical protein NDU88_001770 [Pleurodeles waltl]
MGQADSQPEVAIMGAVSGTTLEGANSVSKREPGGDLVSGLAKVPPWLAKLGNAPQMDLASEGSALATLKGLAMGISANLQGATTGTHEPPRATAITLHEPTSPTTSSIARRRLRAPLQVHHHQRIKVRALPNQVGHMIRCFLLGISSDLTYLVR